MYITQRHPTARDELRQQRTGMQGCMPWAFERSRKRSLKGGSAGFAGAKTCDGAGKGTSRPLPRHHLQAANLWGIIEITKRRRPSITQGGADMEPQVSDQYQKIPNSDLRKDRTYTAVGDIEYHRRPSNYCYASG